MNAKSIALGIIVSLFISSIASAYSVPYYNKDSKTNTFELKSSEVFEKLNLKLAHEERYIACQCLASLKLNLQMDE
jgi:hypothetical protein|tara:strand:- start:250 stop:477 length:228 start_codon:yes stop_codon:yes gene_type:complete